MAENDDAGTIGPDVAARLIMVEPGAFDQLVRRGWFKPVGVRRYRLVGVVQGYIKSVQHEIERGRSQAQAAAHIDMGSRRFQELLESGVIPRQKMHGYNLDDVRLVYIRHLRAIAAGQGAGAGVTLAGERALLAREQREAATLKNQISRGDFVSLQLIKRHLMERFAVIRERLLTVPGKCADACSMRTRDEIEAILLEEIIEALSELHDPADYGRHGDSRHGAGSTDGAQTAAEPESDRVG
jgi:phage terminase Nu1 subunit (DNA packaging protein)